MSRPPEPREAQAGWEREDHDRQWCGVGAASGDVAGRGDGRGREQAEGCSLKRRSDARTFAEQSPVASSARNGVIERGKISVEGQVRVLKDGFEARLCKKVPSDHAALAWLVEFAAVLINRYEVGHDGKTPYERLREKPSKL